jgi:hypothetical protein
VSRGTLAGLAVVAVVTALWSGASAGGVGSSVMAASCGNSCSPPPPPPPAPGSGTGTTPTGWYAGTNQTFQPIDYDGTTSTAPGSYYNGTPAACVGEYEFTSSAFGPGGARFWGPGDQESYLAATDGVVAWPWPAGGLIGDLQQDASGTGGRVNISTADGAVLLADYSVYGEFYQPLKANPNKAAGQSACVDSGLPETKGLYAMPICSAKGSGAICNSPGNPSQIQNMENILVNELIGGNLSAGSVVATPPLNAAVNLPTYFYLQGDNVPPDATASGSQISDETFDGRALVLTVTATLQESGVEWCFGDGICTMETGPDAAGAAGTSSGVSHTYHEVSVQGETPSPYQVVNSQDEIPVTAYVVETLSAKASWIYPTGKTGSESLGGRSMYVPATFAGSQPVWNSTPPSTALAPVWIRIGQIEGVPYCPNSQSCS